MSNKLELKFVGGTVRETAQATRNGVPVGIVKGYIATWDKDKADRWGESDQFVKGAFAKSIAAHKAAGTQIKFRDAHGRTVGGFDMDSIVEDDIGLFGIAEINLDVQQGIEVYSLAKQGVKNRFSIGFRAEEWSVNEKTDIRTILEAEVVEGSLVDEPRNDRAVVTEVKAKGESMEIKQFTVVEAKAIKTQRQFEEALRESGAFSKDAATMMASQFKGEIQGEPDTLEDVELKAALDALEAGIDSTAKRSEECELNRLIGVLDTCLN